MSEIALIPTGGAAQGAMAAGQGIGNLGKALAMGGSVRDDAVQKTALALSKIYANNMSGDKHGEETRGLKMTNDGRSNIKAILEANPDLEPFWKTQLLSYSLTNPEHLDDFARSAEIHQRMSDKTAIKADPSKATPAAQAYFATSGNAPFDNVGNTGASLNRATGAQNVTSDVINRVYENKGTGKAGNTALKPNDVIKNDIAIDRLAQQAYSKEYPLDAFGKRAPSAPTMQEYIAAYRSAREARNPTAPANKNPATPATTPTITPIADVAAAEAVREQYRAGKITRDQAKSKLQALGMAN